jgi:hypothetical protein
MVYAKQIKELSDSMSQLLDDMGREGQSVSLYAKAKARIAFEPFRDLDDDPTAYMNLDHAISIVAETEG